MVIGHVNMCNGTCHFGGHGPDIGHHECVVRIGHPIEQEKIADEAQKNEYEQGEQLVFPRNLIIDIPMFSFFKT
ncbi:MAG: hypothetical protein BA872_08535 [Desulfobacterales bacterium C00003060]|nr:MAG: hypothetical protein BA861_08110 [Desulfobacterales bacterium S3730MH5]OEU81826.1 MAG: hypothetical protein BA872_08535 [Desulfobacterales bacterium C00003060]OEU82786.1 MAG: hypothetical protein BA865_01815 [Desulfobacterales bacterium S5133MH4]